jgi:hypothetical protein
VDELLREAIGLQRLSIGASDDVVLVSQADADAEELLGLSDAVPAQLVNDQAGQGHSAALARLGFLFSHDRSRLFRAGDNGELTGVESHRPPQQGRDLAPPLNKPASELLRDLPVSILKPVIAVTAAKRTLRESLGIGWRMVVRPHE